MLTIRLACVLALTGMFGVGSLVACTQQSAAAPTGDDDDDTAADDDDDSSDDDDDATGTDGGSSSGSTSSSSSSGAPVDSGPPPKPRSELTFFVTSVPAGTGGNLGGLAGADKKCQDLATAVQAGDHTWAAFLSIQGTNAKDRIGPGPWKNQKGTVVASNVAALFSELTPLTDSLFVDEKGADIPAEGRFILTGTNAEGLPNGNNRNCNGWTSNQGNANASFGDTKPSTSPILGSNWAFAKGNNINNNNLTCNQLNTKGTQGRIFCFAKD